MEKKQVNIVLEENLYKDIKINAVVEGFSMKKYIETILRLYMDGKNNPKDIQERLYNSYDLSLFLQCDRRTITKYYKDGKLKGVKYGNEYWSTADQVKEFLNNRKEGNKMIEATREREISRLMKKALESIGLTKKVVKENCHLNDDEYENYLYCLILFVNEVIDSKYYDMQEQKKEYSNVYENYKINDRQYNFTFNGLYNDIISMVTRVEKEGK